MKVIKKLFEEMGIPEGNAILLYDTTLVKDLQKVKPEINDVNKVSALILERWVSMKELPTKSMEKNYKAVFSYISSLGYSCQKFHEDILKVFKTLQ